MGGAIGGGGKEKGQRREADGAEDGLAGDAEDFHFFVFLGKSSGREGKVVMTMSISL
jgi:hypothetical protein